MIRVLLAGLLIALIALVALKVLASARKAKVDWTGLAFIAGFIALAFWLHDLTGMG